MENNLYIIFNIILELQCGVKKKMVLRNSDLVLTSWVVPITVSKNYVRKHMTWRRKWQPTPVFLPGESQGRGSLVGCHLWGRTESDTTDATQQQQQQQQEYLYQRNLQLLKGQDYFQRAAFPEYFCVFWTSLSTVWLKVWEEKLTSVFNTQKTKS